MQRALATARQTPAGDVPVGAVLYDAAGRELATGVNRREQLRIHGDGWRLSGCELVVTLEPCAMCAGALQSARVSSLVFGAYEPKTGACGSLIDVLRAPTAPFSPQVRGGVLEKDCVALLEKFFTTLREK